MPVKSLSAVLAKECVEKGLVAFQLATRHISLSVNVRVHAPWIMMSSNLYSYWMLCLLPIFLTSRGRYFEEVFSSLSIHYLSLIITPIPSYHTGQNLFILF